MPKRTIVVATENSKAVSFFSEYFRDTASIPTVIRDRHDFAELAACRPEVVFIESDWVNREVAAQLKRFASQTSSFRCFGLGTGAEGAYEWSGILSFPIDQEELIRVVFPAFALPNPVKVLVVDDEPGILKLVYDFFTLQKQPKFEVFKAADGLEGFKQVKEHHPHCLILDLKMPVRSGIRLYRDLIVSGLKIPTVIFIDTSASDDIQQIRSLGNPVFLEKGGTQGSMQEVMAVVQKLVIFS